MSLAGLGSQLSIGLFGFFVCLFWFGFLGFGFCLWLPFGWRGFGLPLVLPESV